MSVSSHTTLYDEHPDGPLTVVVMGPTGTGKTSFINLFGGDGLPVGESLESCTDSVQATEPFEFDGHMIRMIDTPGFDDTSLKETDVLQMVAAHLSFSQKSGQKLAGVIYLHRILDNRMGGISARNFRMFRSLCGDSSLQKVLIVTTMWDQVSERLAEAREFELSSKDVFFKPVLDKGARLARHRNTTESAQAILRSVLETYSDGMSLQIQKELDSGLDIAQTTAGKELSREIQDQISNHHSDMRKLVLEICEATMARDNEAKKELIEEKQRLQDIVRELQQDSARLSSGYKEKLAKLEERVHKAETSAMKSAMKAFEQRGYAYKLAETPAAEPGNNGVMEANGSATAPVVGLWGRFSVMLAPFALSWK